MLHIWLHYTRGSFARLLRPVNDLEQEVWMQMAQFSGEIAQSLSLPVDTARDLAESLRWVTTIVFGPDLKEEVI